MVACAAVAGALTLFPAARSAQAETQYYVSLGDSYAAGFQPARNGLPPGTSAAGFAYQVPALARKRGYDLKVVNFGCVAATTSQMMRQAGCPAGFLGPGAKPFGKSQIEAAVEFIRANRRAVALITVSIGGNDFLGKCLSAGDPVACVRGTLGAVQADVSSATRRLRRAAGNRSVLVGTTYPNVLLGGWVNPGGVEARRLATRWQPAFRSHINPALKVSYEKGGGKFVDVTAATGGYGDLKAMTTLEPYGSIPKPVADICRLSWSCSLRDYHPNRAGYRIIAGKVAAELPIAPVGARR